MELLTVDDLADVLRTTPAGVRRMRQRGTLPPAVKVGTRVLWRRDELERWLDDHREDDARARIESRPPRPEMQRTRRTPDGLAKSPTRRATDANDST